MENNRKIYGDVVGAPVPKLDVYSKEEINKMFAGGCKYMGEVETLDDLPYLYTFKAIGAPYIMQKGVKTEVGTYNSETGEVTFDRYEVNALPGVVVPVEGKTIKAGYYFGKVDLGTISIESGQSFIHYYVGDFYEDEDYITCGQSKPVYYGEFFVSGLSVVLGTNFYSSFIDGTSAITGSVQKVGVDKEGAECEPLEVGHIYKVLDENVSYIWTGEKWDVFSVYSEGADLFETALGDIDAALDSIIEIQNSLIGGEAV